MRGKPKTLPVIGVSVKPGQMALAPYGVRPRRCGRARRPAWPRSRLRRSRRRSRTRSRDPGPAGRPARRRRRCRLRPAGARQWLARCPTPHLLRRPCGKRPGQCTQKSVVSNSVAAQSEPELVVDDAEPDLRDVHGHLLADERMLAHAARPSHHLITNTGHWRRCPPRAGDAPTSSRCANSSAPRVIGAAVPHQDRVAASLN